MRPLLIAAAAALGALVGAESLTQDHWILNWATPIAVGRIDPIISPGSVSAHVHNIVGASNFNTVPPPPQSLLTRAQRFVEDNHRVLLLGAAVAAASGAGYYLYTRGAGSEPGTGGAGPGAAGGASAAAAKKNKKKKSKKSAKGDKDAFVKGEGSNGPLLEEIPREEKKAEHLADVPDAAALAVMSDEARNELGQKLKEQGNKLYSKKEFKKAVECYTKAIDVSVRKDPVFYSNRAACYSNYSPKEYELCVADCDEALKLDRNYVKALKRRATALEQLGRDEEAVRDFTATTILERFADEQAAASVERCLKKVATKKAKEVAAAREAKLPSPTFVSAYLSAFRPRAKPALPTEPSQGDQTLDLAFDALAAADYTHALTFTNEALEQGISTSEGQAEAYNLRGTFKFLVGDSHGSLDDFAKSIDLVPTFVQSWVKMASVHMEVGDAANAFGDFETAIRHNAVDPDIYYHRGQVYFILQDYDKAMQDYTKSIELDDGFIFTHVQAAVAQYKLGNIAASMAAFRRILKQFPDRGEPSNYYGEILLDQQKYQESVERFDRAIELDEGKKPRNVLPFVNKALALFQWQQDIGAAERLCRDALAIDPECDVAIATVAQLSLQQGKLDEAVEWFEKAAKLARTEAEILNALSYSYAARAQQQFIAAYPEHAERLGQAVASGA
ncbi:TOM (translocase of outer membrane) complex component [Cryptotrichosporon argae]